MIHYSASNQNQDTLEQVNNALAGFFKVVTIKSSEESLSLYGDDRDEPVTYQGDFSSGKIISFVLKNFDSFLDKRGSEAKELKAFQEFQEK
jgi:hypothetical protein